MKLDSPRPPCIPDSSRSRWYDLSPESFPKSTGDIPVDNDSKLTSVSTTLLVLILFVSAIIFATLSITSDSFYKYNKKLEHRYPRTIESYNN